MSSVPSSEALTQADESAAEDLALMQDLAHGNAEAFRTLVEKHQHAVIGTVAKMMNSPSEAEDIAQQVFLKVWKHAKSFQPKAKFTTWLFTITRNLVINESTKRARRKTSSLDELWEEAGERHAGSERQPDEALKQSELNQTVDTAISKLPEKQRLCLILSCYQNLPYTEIASVLSISVPAVKSQLFRARSSLKEELASFLKEAREIQ